MPRQEKRSIGEFEQVVLLAILQRRASAYAPDVAAMLEASTGRTISRGALYSALDRLERKKMVRWSTEAATSERGGHPKRLFEVTDDGIKALKASRNALLTLWNGLEELLTDEPR